MSGTEQQGKQGGLERGQSWGEQLRRLLLIVAASVVMAVNIKSFVDAGGLFPGGFNGLTLLIQRSAQQFAGVSRRLPQSTCSSTWFRQWSASG